MKRKFFLVIFLLLFAVLLIFFLSSRKNPNDSSDDINWGLTFSKDMATRSGFYWKEVYLAILDELTPSSLRIPLNWEDLEPVAGTYDFSSYDWMMEEAQKRNISVILVIGREMPYRQLSCHIPDWTKDSAEPIRQSKALDLISRTVYHYKDRENLKAWQVEDKLFNFWGNCFPSDIKFFTKEIDLVRKLDSSHPVIVTDSGEIGDWVRASQKGDILGVTVYSSLWNDLIGQINYPSLYRLFWSKINILHFFYPQKQIIALELQGEPSGAKGPFEISKEKQEESFGFSKFEENIEYAKKIGLKEIYLDGAEWWYWQKNKNNNAQFWEKAGNLIKHK